METKIKASVESWLGSGLTKKAWSEREGIPESRFRYWVKKYHLNRKRLRSDSDLNEVFMPVQVSGSPVERVLSIRYPNGVELSVPSDTGTVRLRELLGLTD